MNAFAKIVSVAIAVILVPCQRSNADSQQFTIHSPKQCPVGLKIESKASNGMIEFDVYVDAEEIAHAGELYKGRVRGYANLNVATSEQPIASVTVLRATEGKRTRYQFRISRFAAKTSVLQLGVYLYEKDGTPTIGGAVNMQVHLAGFEPKMQETDEEKAKQ